MAQGTDIGIQQVILHLSEARKVVGAEISECAGQLGQLGRVRALTALGESIEALLRQAEQTSNEKLRATGLSKEQPQRLPKQAKDEYPKFFIRGDLLVKRGLSRGGKKTYEHSFPKATVEAVIGLLA